MARDRPPQAPYPGFVELPTFTRRWAALGLDDRDLQALQEFLGDDPDVGNVVRGAGGLRKARFAPPSWRTGKSGAVRVYYANLPGVGVIVLAVVFAKGEASDIGAKQRRALIEQVRAIERQLGGG
jgi:hypothetical protein